MLVLILVVLVAILVAILALVESNAPLILAAIAKEPVSDSKTNELVKLASAKELVALLFTKELVALLFTYELVADDNVPILVVLVLILVVLFTILVANEAEAALKAPLIDAVTLAPADPKIPFESCTTRLVGPTLLLLLRVPTVAVPSTLNAPVIDREPVNW